MSFIIQGQCEINNFNFPCVQYTVQTGTVQTRTYNAACCSMAQDIAMGNASAFKMTCPTNKKNLSFPWEFRIGECTGAVNCWTVDMWYDILVFVLKAAGLIMVE